MGVLQAFDLTGRVAVVTGGNMGLGEAFARALAESGAQVAIAARTHDRNEMMAESIEAGGGRAIALDLDVTDPEGVDRMVNDVTERLGPIDVLVNNAGVCYHRPALEVSRDEWQQVFD